MATISFLIIPASDKDYIAAFIRMASDGSFTYDRVHFDEYGELRSSDIQPQLQEVLDTGMRVFQRLIFRFPNDMSVSIQRQSNQPSTLFDQVTVSSPQQVPVSEFAKLVAAAQRNLGMNSLLNIGNLLGPTATQHFEAREAALARLETLSSNLLVEMEDARKRREAAFFNKEQLLEARLEKKQSDLNKALTVRQAELDRRASELESLQKELDDREAKHARRQHYKDIKEKFRSWSNTFKVTDGTKQLRVIVFRTTISLMVLFGIAACIFLFQSFSATNTALLAFAIVKQVTFTALFVTTAYFFIRWNNQWFQRHANEEFRLKRMELDIDRASWFVEMAFEWKDEKGEEIPLELIEPLTQGLFAGERDDHAVEPADSLAQALLGAARFKVKLPDGTEAEYDRKGMERLFRKSKQHCPNEYFLTGNWLARIGVSLNHCGQGWLSHRRKFSWRDGGMNIDNGPASREGDAVPVAR